MSAAKKAIEAWIDARRAEGYWITGCAICGSLFAQNRHDRGRRAVLCDRLYCIRAQRWRKATGRLPPEWLQVKWRSEYGERTRESALEHPPRERAV